MKAEFNNCLNRCLRTIFRFGLILLIAYWAPITAAVVPMIQAGKTIKITENVFVIPDQRVALVPNIGIIIGENDVMVVDTGMGPANAEIVLTEVRKITSKPISYLVSTHFHPEHNFGAQSFPDETTIIFSNAQQTDLQKKGQQYIDLFIELFGDDVRDLLAAVKILPADITFERKIRLNLGNIPVELLHFGRAAHTGGDTLVYLPQQKILFAGGLTPNRFFPIMPDPDSSGQGWIKSLEQLQKLDIETIIPGHGEVGDKQLVNNVKTYLLVLRSRVTQLKSGNQSVDEIKKILLPEFKAKHPDWDESFWINNAVENFYSN